MQKKSSKAKPESKLVSIIIPAYKAESFVERSLIEVKQVLDQIRYPYEIICVADGKADKTYEKAKKLSKRFPGKVRAVGYLTNLGKGHAVRYGMARAKGDIIGFIDVGFELNPNGLSMLLEHFEWYKADIIVGSKRHQASKVTYPWQRKILSIVYQIVVRILFGLNVRDTQVGMKFFRREVLERVMPRLVVKAFAFDIEMLSVANYLGYRAIYEAPVELKMKFEANISTIASKGFITTSFKMLWDTAAVFYRLRILRFYDDKNRKNWITPEYLKINSSK
jgi:glycosyltransferase involved in cell wall biosynthesis